METIVVCAIFVLGIVSSYPYPEPVPGPTYYEIPTLAHSPNLYQQRLYIQQQNDNIQRQNYENLLRNQDINQRLASQILARPSYDIQPQLNSVREPYINPVPLQTVQRPQFEAPLTQQYYPVQRQQPARDYQPVQSQQYQVETTGQAETDNAQGASQQIIQYPRQYSQYNTNHLAYRPRIQQVLASTPLKKRYLVLHPNGTIEHIDKIEHIVEQHPNYILVNAGSVIPGSSKAVQSPAAPRNPETPVVPASSTTFYSPQVVQAQTLESVDPAPSPVNPVTASSTISPSEPLTPSIQNGPVPDRKPTVPSATLILDGTVPGPKPTVLPSTGPTTELPPVSAPIAQPPVSAPIAQPPVSAPTAQPPVSAPVAQPPVSAPVAQPPVSAPVAQPPVSAPIAQPPVSALVARPPVSAPIAQPPVSDPIAQPPVSAPIAQPPVSAPIAQPPVSAPIAQPPVSAPIAQPPVSAPVAQPPVSAPVAQPPVSAPPVILNGTVPGPKPTVLPSTGPTTELPPVSAPTAQPPVILNVTVPDLEPTVRPPAPTAQPPVWVTATATAVYPPPTSPSPVTEQSTPPSVTAEPAPTVTPVPPVTATATATATALEVTTPPSTEDPAQALDCPTTVAPFIEPSDPNTDLDILQVNGTKPVVWFRTQDLDFWKKLTQGNETFDVLYFFNIPREPRVTKETKTTIHADGTVVEEITQTIQDDVDSPPRIIKTTTITKPDGTQSTT